MVDVTQAEKRGVDLYSGTACPLVAKVRQSGACIVIALDGGIHRKTMPDNARRKSSYAVEFDDFRLCGVGRDGKCIQFCSGKNSNDDGGFSKLFFMYRLAQLQAAGNAVDIFSDHDWQ